MKTISFLITALILLFLVTTFCFAGKTSLDPNSRPKAIPQIIDQRLDQPITYQTGYKRLHNFTEELSELTGIPIRAGKNKEDWRVRDIPLVVCVKEISLGKLLRAIADCAHVELRIERVGADDDKPTYRFMRSRKAEDDLLNTKERRIEANRKLASWACDTLVAYAAMPEVPLEIKNKYDFFKIDGEQIRLVSQILVALGPEAKTKVFADEPVTIKVNQSPHAELIKKLIIYASSNLRYGQRTVGMNSTLSVMPTKDQLDNAILAINITRTDNAWNNAGFSFYLHPIPSVVNLDGEERTVDDSWQADPVEMARMLSANKQLKLPPPPNVDDILHSNDKFPSDSFKLIDLENDGTKPILQKHVTISYPTAIKKPMRADSIVALAKAADMNIVTEDEVSHMTDMYGAANIPTDTDITLNEALKKLDKQRLSCCTKWFLNTDDKLLVGWLNDWRENHQYLIPESLLNGIESKRQALGADIDDLTSLLDYKLEALWKWIAHTPEYLGYCPDIHPEDIPIWQLYNSLSSESKRLVKSEAGLPLAAIDPTLISYYFINRSSEESQRVIRLYTDSPDTTLVDIANNPRCWVDITLHLKSKPLESWDIITSNTEWDREMYSPGAFSPIKHTYVLSLEGDFNGKPLNSLHSTWSGIPLPLFTLEKEAELRKKAEERRIHK